MNRYIFLLAGGMYVEAFADGIRDAMQQVEAEHHRPVWWGKRYTEPGVRVASPFRSLHEQGLSVA